MKKSMGWIAVFVYGVSVHPPVLAGDVFNFSDNTNNRQSSVVFVKKEKSQQQCMLSNPSDSVTRKDNRGACIFAREASTVIRAMPPVRCMLMVRKLVFGA